MLLSTEVNIRWNGFTRKHYEEKGYKWTKQNDFFTCNIKDVQLNSTVKVDVKCDYCCENFTKEYRRYHMERKIVEKDCCKNRKCMITKSEEVNIKKYGFKSYAKTDASKEFKRSLYQTPKEEVSEIIESKDLEILNIKDYENDRTRLMIICKNHRDKGVQETNFANIKKNKHCCYHARAEHSGKTLRLSGEKVFNDFKDMGLTPLFSPKDYISNSQPLPYECSHHLEKGVQYRSYSNLGYCKGCLQCSRERTSKALLGDEKEVYEYFVSRGLTPINFKYEGKHEHIEYHCNLHNNITQKTTYGNLVNTKTPCDLCRIDESVSKLNRRLRSSVSRWRKESEANCNYQCFLTKSTKYDVHHIVPFNVIIHNSILDLEFEIKSEYSPEEFMLIKKKVVEYHNTNLGVCIHPLLHIEYHRIYGKIGNNKEQLNEFIERYYNGEFTGILGGELANV